MPNRTSFQLISDCRSELMGYAILGVFICHIIMRIPYDFPLLPDLARLVYTQGFIFLSGFGLYFSYSKNSNLTHYFKRRVNRLFIPYLLMSFPFLTVIVIVTGQSFINLLGYLTTISFWFNGNFYGMWYIAVQLMLYIVFPLLMFCMFYQNKWVILRSLTTIFILIAVILFIKNYDANYFAAVGIWTKRVVMFPLGMLCGYLCARTSNVKTYISFIIIPILVCLYALTKYKYGFYFEYVRALTGIFTLSVVFFYTKQRHWSLWINKVLQWLGKYSLELYVLHVLIFKTIDSCIDNASVIHMALSILIALLICVPVHNTIDKVINSITKSS